MLFSLEISCSFMYNIIMNVQMLRDTEKKMAKSIITDLSHGKHTMKTEIKPAP